MLVAENVEQKSPDLVSLQRWSIEFPDRPGETKQRRRTDLEVQVRGLVLAHDLEEFVDFAGSRGVLTHGCFSVGVLKTEREEVPF